MSRAAAANVAVNLEALGFLTQNIRIHILGSLKVPIVMIENAELANKSVDADTKPVSIPVHKPNITQNVLTVVFPISQRL